MRFLNQTILCSPGEFSWNDFAIDAVGNSAGLASFHCDKPHVSDILYVVTGNQTVVRFFTAWKLNEEKSAIEPANFPCH